jgi:hypothetical protein
MNEAELSLELVGQLMRRMQAEQRTLLAEVRSYRRDLNRIEAGMVTRDMIEAERDSFMSRLENLESEVAHGFGQVLAHLRRG